MQRHQGISSAVQSSCSVSANFILQGRLTTCANNCRGVDPNSIIGAGVAAAFIGGIAAPALLPLFVGAGGIAAGAGGSMLLQTSCPSRRQCRVNTNSPGYENFTVCSSFSPRLVDDAVTFSSTAPPATQFVHLHVNEITSFIICNLY